MRREGDEGLAVGLLVKRDAAVAVDDAKSLDLGGNVEVALRAQEEAVARSTVAAHRPHELVQARLGVSRAEVEVLRAALGVESGEDCDRFDQRRFARAILADEERDLGIELELVESLDGRDRERIDLKIANAVANQPNGPQISRRRLHQASGSDRQ